MYRVPSPLNVTISQWMHAHDISEINTHTHTKLIHWRRAVQSAVSFWELIKCYLFLLYLPHKTFAIFFVNTSTEQLLWPFVTTVFLLKIRHTKFWNCNFGNEFLGEKCTNGTKINNFDEPACTCTCRRSRRARGEIILKRIIGVKTLK